MRRQTSQLMEHGQLIANANQTEVSSKRDGSANSARMT